MLDVDLRRLMTCHTPSEIFVAGVFEDHGNAVMIYSLLIFFRTGSKVLVVFATPLVSSGPFLQEPAP